MQFLTKIPVKLHWCTAGFSWPHSTKIRGILMHDGDISEAKFNVSKCIVSQHDMCTVYAAQL